MVAERSITTVTSGRLAAGWLLAGIEMDISRRLHVRGAAWLASSLAVATSCWEARHG